jgi:hypothetical protein
MKTCKQGLFLLLSLSILAITCAKKTPGETELPDEETTIVYEKTIGGDEADYGFAILKTANNGIMIAGHTFSFGAGQSDVYCIRADTTGDTIWTSTYGGSTIDEARSMIQTSNGNFVIVGYTDSYGMGWTDVYVLSIDQSGALLWSKTYGTPRSERGRAGIQTLDDYYLIAGYTECPSGNNTDLYLIKANENGDTIWTRAYGDTLQFDETAYGVIETDDRCYVLLGEKRYSFGWGWIWLMKTDSLGDSVWADVYGGSEWDRGHSILRTDDNCYIITGSIESDTEDNADVLLMKIDDTGSELWTMKYGGSADDIGYSVIKASGGGYIITGSTKSFGNQWEEDVYLIKTNAEGDEEWSESFGGSLPDYGYSALEMDDGSLIIGGCTSSYGAGSYDVYLLKILHASR